MDPDVLKSRLHKSNNDAFDNVKKPSINGFLVKYIGCVEVGNRGDVKVIDKATRRILAMYNDKSKTRSDSPKIQEVCFEIGEMGVKIVDKITSTVNLMFGNGKSAKKSASFSSFLVNIQTFLHGNILMRLN